MPYKRFRALLPAREYHYGLCHTCDDCHIDFWMKYGYGHVTEDVLEVMWGVA